MNIKINDETVEFTQIQPKGATTGLYFVDTKKRYFLKKVFPKFINTLQTEIFFLKKLEKYDCFPKLIHIDRDFIVTTYVGETGTQQNAPSDYALQCNKIYNILLHENIVIEVKKEHLTVKNGKIYMVDFGYAFFKPYIANRITHIKTPFNPLGHNDVAIPERMKRVFEK